MVLIEGDKTPFLLLGKEIKMHFELNSAQTKGALKIEWVQEHRPSMFANWFYSKEK